MPIDRSTTDKKQIRTAATSPKELFQHTQARHDETRLSEENIMQENFRAVILSSPIDENNVGTAKAGPNAHVTPLGYVVLSVKPISDQEFLRVRSGESSSELSQVDNPVPSDSLYSFNNLKKEETDKFLALLHRYHKISDLRAKSVDPIANTVSLQFGQIVNCYYRKGNPNSAESLRDELVFETPAQSIVHPFYVSFLGRTELNNAKEPFENNSENAVSILGATPRPSESSTPSGRPTVSGPDAIGTGPNFRFKKYGGLGYFEDSGFSGRKEGVTKNPTLTALDKQLIDRIVKFESFGGSYSAFNRLYYTPKTNKDGSKGYDHEYATNGKVGRYHGKKIEEMTFAEVKNSQKKYRRNGTKRKYPTTDPGPNNFFAMGKFQFIPTTMYSVVRKIGFKDDEIFSPKNQDIMGYYLIYSGNKRKYLTDYLLGGGTSLWTALFDLSAEFSSIQAPDGKGYYGNEHAGNSAKVMSELLKKIRADNIANGRTGK